MESRNVDLHLFASARRHDGATLLVDVAHQLVRLVPAVAEQLLEDVGDVAHQVDRIVPDDGDPWPVRVDDVLVDRRLDALDRRRRGPGHDRNRRAWTTASETR